MINFSPINNSYSYYKSQKKQVLLKKNSKDIESLNLPYYGVQKSDYIKLAIQKTPNNDDIHIYRLSNGQKIAIVQKEGCPSIECRIGTGSLDEPEGKTGLAHLIEHSSFHSSKKYEDIESEIKKLGGYSNAATTTFDTSYYITLDNNKEENIVKAIDILTDMIYNPKFNKLDKEKAVVKAEAQKYEQDEYNISNNMIKKELIGLDSNSVDIISGNSKTIDSITKEDLFSFHDSFYTPNNSAFVIVSDNNPDKLIKSIAGPFLEAYNKKQAKETKRPFFPLKTGIKRKDIVSKEDTIGYTKLEFLIKKSNNPIEKIKLDALLYLIESSTNFVSLNAPLNSYYSTISLEASLNETNEYELLNKLQELLKKFTLGGIEDYQLDFVKNVLIEKLDLSCNDNLQIADNASSNLLNSGFCQEKELIRNLSKEDIIDAIKYFDFNNFAFVNVHPKGTSLVDIEKKYNDSKKMIQPVIVPKNIQRIDISNKMQTYNIEPYSKDALFTAILPDNTRFIALNSKNNECNIIKELYNPNLDSYNTACRYVLEKMKNSLNVEQNYNQIKNNSTTFLSLDSNTGFILGASAKVDNISETLKILKSRYDIDFTIEKFNEAKKEALVDISNLKEDAYSAYCKDAFGQNHTKNPYELKKALESLTLSELILYYNEIVKNSYSTVVVSAPFVDNLQLLNEIASGINISGYCFKNPQEQIERKIKNTTSKTYAKETLAQPRMQSLYNFSINSNPKDRIRFVLLASILSNRLYDDLREKQGLAYSVSANYSSLGSLGTITLDIQSSCNNKNDVDRIFQGFSNNIQKLIQKPVTNAELEEAKSEYRRNIYNSRNVSFAFEVELLEYLKTPQGLESIQSNIELLDRIGIEDIQKTACYAFSCDPVKLINADKKIIDEINKN